MSKISRSSIVGFHNIKNKVSRNAFDLSHRHMFTAQIGELLPVFVQWVNPNETFKIGYSGFTRTQPLQTAAFTRLRENIQYYFVPFQSLWKYFEQQVTNMTSGQSGENISRIAQTAFSDSAVTTGMPYLNYSWFLNAFQIHFNSLLGVLVQSYNGYLASNSNRQPSYDYLLDRLKGSYGETYVVNETLRYASTAKLLRALGYINTDADTYDAISSLLAYGAKHSGSVTVDGFQSDPDYGFRFDYMNYMSVENAPNLSIFPLLAYQKIVQDHYIYRQWQPFKSYACNIDYLKPTDSMNFSSQLGNAPLSADLFSMQYSNLPLDYFNGVLPKAQYGEESAVSVSLPSQGSSTGLVTSQPTYRQNMSSYIYNTQLQAQQTPEIHSTSSGQAVSTVSSGTVTPIVVGTPHTHTFSVPAGSSGDGTFKISALRSAIALQKYKEIQESNDSDFASQVLAHFGIKPKHDDYKYIYNEQSTDL